MEVSMSITRRGKYTNSNICINVQVRNVVCLFFLLYANLLVLVTLCEGNHYPFIEEDNKNPLLMKKNCRFFLVFAKKEVIFYHEFILMSVPNLQYLQASAMRRTLAFPNGRRAKPSE